MITMLIGVDNILNISINWLCLHLLYVYYFMLCILVYQFELYGIMRIMYQHLNNSLLHFMKEKMATMCAPSWFHVACCKTFLSINLHG